MQTHAEPRFKKRVPCKIVVGDTAHMGMVLNVSRGGLFVQTSVQARPGDELRIHLNLESPPEAVPLGGRVVWRRGVAAHLRSVSRGGIGMRLRQVPESYYRFLSQLAEAGDRDARASTRPPIAAPEAAPVDDRPSYRVRVQQQGGPRSRTLTVVGDGEEDARRRALARVGAGWLVLEVQALAQKS